MFFWLSGRQVIGRWAFLAAGLQVHFGTMETVITLFICWVLSAACFGQMKDNSEWSQKFNSNGAFLVLKETGRNPVNGQTVVAYDMFVSGLPKVEDYTLWTRLVGSDPRPVTNAFINKDGLVVNVLADPAHGVAEDPIHLKVSAAAVNPRASA